MSFTAEDEVTSQFLKAWPIERVRSMTLAEYSTAGDKECFTYWLETRLSTSGSILGGSAFKFGVYSRKNNKPKKGDRGRVYGKGYAWLDKYGDSFDSAFENVKKHVVAIVNAVRAGQLEAIDDIPISPAFKWKIAYHYQPTDTPLIACIFKRQAVVQAAGKTTDDPTVPLSQLYRELGKEKRDDESMIEFSARVWRRWTESNVYEVKLTTSALRTGQLPISLVHAPFPNSMHGGATVENKAAEARFRTDTGLEFESDIREQDSSSGFLRYDVREYLTRIHAKPDDVLYIVREGDLSYQISRTEESSVVPPTPETSTKRPNVVTGNQGSPLNQILFGPPGTGKTYHTIDKALEILDPKFIAANRENRIALKRRYDELAVEGLVKFVTFHQSFSYEDFVEGLRANTDAESGALRYEIVDGVFKEVCIAASAKIIQQEQIDFDATKSRIWKLSLGNSYTEQHIFDECIANNYALVGFGGSADYSNVSDRDEIVKRYQAAGGILEQNDYGITAINLFVRQMKKGDLIVVTEGNLKFRAIGEVTGDYRILPNERGDTYVQCRNVRWLRVYKPSLPADQLMDNRFSQMTMYELRDGSINMEKLRTLLSRDTGATGQAKARVLIIDEINRGNVSRVFGELITLIEPSKRSGADEALKVILPYSKDEFSVPDNVFLIGTMNTADRSLAGIDIALRRRFQFVEMAPQPELLKNISVAGLNLGHLLDSINQRIEVLLDRDHQIGHAYFMSIRDGDPLERLGSVFRYQIVPLLQEYFFEDWQRIAWVLNEHRKDAEFCFLQRTSTNVAALFGNDPDVPSGATRWRINEDAFRHPESYLGILSAS